jgi:hypothetical protein
MSYSIAQVLYDWMHEKRIVLPIAREMGINPSTLAAELRQQRTQAKLGADELIPLFNAIRRIGYGSELKGILHQFVAEMEGREVADLPDQDLIPHVLRLNRSLGILADCAARISTISDEAELARIYTMLRTEVLPVILKMESTVASRIKDIRKSKRGVTAENWLSPMPAPAQVTP